MSSTVSGPPAAKPTEDFVAHVHSISRQSSVFLLGTLFTVAASYLFKIYLARTLGAEALGIYALGMTAGGLVSIVGAAGVPQTASRFVAIYASTALATCAARYPQRPRPRLTKATESTMVAGVPMKFVMTVRRATSLYPASACPRKVVSAPNTMMAAKKCM